MQYSNLKHDFEWDAYKAELQLRKFKKTVLINK